MKYYIGDLCYLLEESIYNEVVCSFKYDDNKWHIVNNTHFAFGSTKYGDGVYLDNYGNYYSVDAGIIGIVLLNSETLCITAAQIEKDGNAKIFEFEGEPPSFSNDNGYFIIGHVVIDTSIDFDYENDIDNE